jgi:hypothetical protein
MSFDEYLVTVLRADPHDPELQAYHDLMRLGWESALEYHDKPASLVAEVIKDGLIVYPPKPFQLEA